MNGYSHQQVTLLFPMWLYCDCGKIASIVFLEAIKHRKDSDKQDMRYTLFCAECWQKLEHQYKVIEGT